MKLLGRYVLLLTLMTCSIHAIANRNYSGEVQGRWNAGDTIFIDGNITVPLNKQLIIAPGAKVYVTGEFSIDIYGQLLAEGTESDTIEFFSDSLGYDNDINSYKGHWQGITFHSTTENKQATSLISYCKLAYVNERWIDEASSYFNTRFCGALIYYKSEIDVSHTLIENCNSHGSLSTIYSKGKLSNVSIKNGGELYAINSDLQADSLYMSHTTGIEMDSTSLEIKHAIIEENKGFLTHFSKSGNIRVLNGSKYLMTDSEVNHSKCRAILAKQSEVTLENCTISNSEGEGAYFVESQVSISTCQILDNTSEGLYFNSDEDWRTTFASEIYNCIVARNGKSGIRFGTNNEAKIFNSTIVYNQNENGWGGVTGYTDNSHLTNCIVCYNGDDFDFQAGGTYSYSIIQGNYVGEDTATTNFKNLDPLFRDGPNGDYRLKSTDCGFFYDSPAIDAGDPTISDMVLDCASAGLGTHLCDIGAYGGGNNWWDKSVNPPCHYSGDVSGVWDCEKIYIDGDILIPEGDTLQITADVEWVLIHGPYQITVEGVLLALGPQNDRTDLGSDVIKFQGSTSTLENTWRGIVFSDLNNRSVGTSIIENCRFDYANRLQAPNPNGGAMLIYNSDSVIIRNSIFYDNIGELGGAIYMTNSNAIIEECYFSSNGDDTGYNRSLLSTAGGALYIKDSNPVLNKLKLLHNDAKAAGAIVLDNSSPTFNHLLIANNTATTIAGGIQCINGSTPTFNYLTSADNSAESVGGTFYLNTGTHTTITNSILYGNTNGEIFLDGGTVEATYSIIQDASAESYFGTGCLDTNPYLSSGKEYRLANNTCSWSDGNNVVSPAIDAGHPDSLDAVLDCDWGLGEERADMGYYGGGASQQASGLKSIEEIKEASLGQNHPNPFSNETQIEFTLLRSGPVSLKVYNLMGVEVATLVSGTLSAGKHSVTLEASTLGQQAKGLLFYKLDTEHSALVKTMTRK